MTVTTGWPRIPYDEAIAKYGTDKPDLRNPIEMQDVTEHFRGSGFKVFAQMIERDPKVRVWAIPAKGGGSRAFCDRMNGWAQKQGQPGLGYIFWRPRSESLSNIDMMLLARGLEAAQLSGDTEAVERLTKKYLDDIEGSGPIAKNIGPELTAGIAAQLDLKAGDACFFTAGDPSKFYKFAGQARDEIGRELKLIEEDRFALCWIVDFPFFEWNEDEKKIDFSHNPFSMPQGGLAALEAAEKEGTEALLRLKAHQYDMVCNGYEIASGGIRNHRPDAMVKAFGIAGRDAREVEERFGALYRAFQYGAPPHGGMAAGIERIVMLLTGCKTVRDVALFPMNQQASDLLMGAPAEASNKQLRELHIRVTAETKG
jgi:aspartyl-tRNA synthetase